MELIKYENTTEYLKSMTLPRTKKDGSVSEPRKDIVIIVLYIVYSGIKPENKGQVDSIIKRNIRPAGLLKHYRYDKIQATMKWLKENADYKWGLETVAKYIDHDLTKFNKPKSFGDNFPEII